MQWVGIGTHTHWDLSDLLRSVQMLKRERRAESHGKPQHLFIPSKTVALIPDFAVEDLPGENCNLGSCVCSERPVLGQNTLMIYIYIYIYFL